MSAVTPRTNMPYPMHSNSVLETLVKERDFTTGTSLTLKSWAEKLEADLDRDDIKKLKKGLPNDFSIDDKFKIVKNPIRLSTKGVEKQASRFLDRNVDLYLVRSQKPTGSKYGYRQIKRAQLSQLYFNIQSLFLVERKGEVRPPGFTWKTKDENFLEWLKELITSQKEEGDSNFPKIKDGKVELAVKKSNIKKILKKLSMKVDRLTPVLMRHEHAWKKMMSKPCRECGVVKGEACPNDKLTDLDKMNSKHYSFLGAVISRLDTVKKKIEDPTKKLKSQNTHNKKLKGVLLGYYTKAMTTKKYPEMKELIGAIEKLFTDEPKLISKIPFACEKRYDMQKRSWNDAIVGSFFPLSREEIKPQKTGARLYFGSTAPPSLLVQNLMADTMKRILARKLVEDWERLGIDKDLEAEYHRREDRLLWEYIATCEKVTVQTKLIDAGYEHGSKYHKLSILNFTEIANDSQPESTEFRGKMAHCLRPDGEGIWEWSDYSEEEMRGKLPIVSPNVTLAEINSIFTSNSEVEGVVICIDHWEIDGDDEDWEFSDMDTHWGIGPDLFHADEPNKGARTFVTFLKRIIDKSKYEIKREDVVHSRRAYGVLLKKELNKFLESK